MLAACDVYRPAAIEQLQKNGEKQGVPVFAMGTNHKPVNIAKAALEHAAKNGNNVVIIDKISPVDIAKAAVEHASKNGFNVVILDTAGRLHIDEGMMEEWSRSRKR